MAIRDDLDRRQIKSDVLITDNESLINRARNNLAATFLQTDYDTLAFIDADIEIEADDFLKLLQMKGVRGAAVAMKHPDFFESLNVFKSGRQVKRSEMDSKPFKADFLGTAVLLLDRSILASLALSVPRYTDPIVGQAYEFFPTYVDNDTLLSEDYGFCKLLKDAGIPIWVHPHIQVKHYGMACWSA